MIPATLTTTTDVRWSMEYAMAAAKAARNATTTAYANLSRAEGKYVPKNGRKSSVVSPRIAPKDLGNTVLD